MEAIEMVKCFLTRTEDEPGSVRYIPFDIYELWRFLMEKVHKLQVVDPQVAIWMPEAYFDDLSDDDKPDQSEAVIEISFKYMQDGKLGKPVVRYFPEENFDNIYGFLRNHFPDDSKMEGVRKRKGYYFTSESVPYTVPE